mmetsp:Transcript_5593/g.18310  ORF Transcript_5593/g.18310 Transcript_5593/m.18310 type:complete len:254 (-) Transcript_5593:379-1140(-)
MAAARSRRTSFATHRSSGAAMAFRAANSPSPAPSSMRKPPLRPKKNDPRSTFSSSSLVVASSSRASTEATDALTSPLRALRADRLCPGASRTADRHRVSSRPSRRPTDNATAEPSSSSFFSASSVLSRAAVAGGKDKDDARNFASDRFASAARCRRKVSFDAARRASSPRADDDDFSAFSFSSFSSFSFPFSSSWSASLASPASAKRRHSRVSPRTARARATAARASGSRFSVPPAKAMASFGRRAVAKIDAR